MIWIFQWWCRTGVPYTYYLLIIACNSVVRFGIASLNNIKFLRTLKIKFEKCSLFTTDDILLLRIYQANVVVPSVSEYVVNHTVDELLIYSLILRVQIEHFECVFALECIQFDMPHPHSHSHQSYICIYKIV